MIAKHRFIIRNRQFCGWKSMRARWIRICLEGIVDEYLNVGLSFILAILLTVINLYWTCIVYLYVAIKLLIWMDSIYPSNDIIFHLNVIYVHHPLIELLRNHGYCPRVKKRWDTHHQTHSFWTCNFATPSVLLSILEISIDFINNVLLMRLILKYLQ